MTRRLAPLLAALAVLPLAACDSDSPTASKAPELDATFAPAYSSGAESVSVELATVQDPRFDLTLEVVAHELPALDGLFFDLLYPPQLLEYRGFEEGPFLAVNSLGQPNREPGRLRVYVDARRSGASTSAGGSGVLLRLFFDGARAGDGDLLFVGFGIDEPGATSPTFGALSWFGGAVDVAYRGVG